MKPKCREFERNPDRLCIDMGKGHEETWVSVEAACGGVLLDHVAMTTPMVLDRDHALRLGAKLIELAGRLP